MISEKQMTDAGKTDATDPRAQLGAREWLLSVTDEHPRLRGEIGSFPVDLRFYGGGMEVEKRFTSLHRLAQLTGLPAEWLKREAKAGRIPYLEIGRRMMFNPKLVEQALMNRCEGVLIK